MNQEWHEEAEWENEGGAVTGQDEQDIEDDTYACAENCCHGACCCGSELGGEG